MEETVRRNDANESFSGQIPSIHVTDIGPRPDVTTRKQQNDVATSSRGSSNHNYVPKIDFRRFDGTDPHSWLLSSEK